MKKTYKFRIYPGKIQETKLIKMLDLCRFTYNKQLEFKINIYKNLNINLSKFDLDKNLLNLKEEFKELNLVHSQVLQELDGRINLAFNHFYRRLKSKENPGFPRFKSKNKYDSITYPQSGFKLDNKLCLSKIGEISIVKHRIIEGKIKTLTIKKSCTGKWYACFSVQQTKPIKVINDNLVGIDLGLNHFYADSDGNFLDNPRFLRKSEERLKLVQRSLSKKVKGSNNRFKTRCKLAKVHEKISNRRLDFLHKESRKLVNTYSNIAVESLNIKYMTQNHYLAKSIIDVSWNKFLQFLSYKVEETGGKLVEVDPRNTSQYCICGNKVKKSLAIRRHKCNACGIELDRDTMSAILVKYKAFGTAGSAGINAWGNVSRETSMNQESRIIFS